jgi:3-hydroxyisobutyrate dehydrogenase/2-hydroxy-3-oxopropionate reductase
MRGGLILVVGASGAGKDSLLAQARMQLADHTGFRFVRRCITRPAEAGGEDHLALGEADFAERLDAGRFALHWHSHGLHYGIDREIDDWLAAGQTVVLNASRAHLPHARERYPALRVIAIVARPETLARRLALRGRESTTDIASRLARQAPLPEDLPVIHVSNDDSLASAATAFLHALHAHRRAMARNSMQHLRIGFIGLGRMGFPMARNLLKAGYSVVAHNRSQAAVARLVALGATTAATPAATAGAADILVSCVMTPAQVEQIYLGTDGALMEARAGQIFIDASTTDPHISRKVAAALAAKGVAFLDAPVSGGPRGAELGTLAVMVGGDKVVLERVRPVLKVFGPNIFHMGPVGAGNSAKLCNQILTGTTHALVAEAMVLGTRLGLDPQTLFEVLQLSSGQCRALDRAVPEAILPRNFAAAFTVDGIIKDLDCALRTADDNGVRLLLPALARQMYQEARALGHGGEHLAAVIRPMERIAGIEVGSANAAL